MQFDYICCPKTSYSMPSSSYFSWCCCLFQSTFDHKNDLDEKKTQNKRENSKSDLPKVLSKQSLSPDSSFINKKSSKNNLRGMKSYATFRTNRPLGVFGKQISPNNSSGYSDMDSMYRRIGIKFSKSKRVSISEAKDNALITGDQHLAKLDEALDDEFRRMKEVSDLSYHNIMSHNSRNISELASPDDDESTIACSDVGDDPVGSSPNSISVASSIITHVRSDSNFSWNSVSDEINPINKIIKMVDLTMARSEVYQLQGNYTKAITVLLDGLNEIQQKITTSETDSSMYDISIGDGVGSGSNDDDALIQATSDHFILKKLLAKLHRRLGSIYKSSGELVSAEFYLRKHIAFTKEIISIETKEEYSKELANSYSTLASLLVELGKPEEATEADKLALDYLSDLPNPY